MAYQSNRNAYVALKAQSGKGTAASGSGARILRTSGGPGRTIDKAPIPTKLIRDDGQRVRGRHGMRRAGVSYDTEFQIGSALDDIMEAVFRGTYSTALTITEATAGLTSITTTANTIVASAGSWITAGLRVGDVIRLTNHSTTANNNRNLRITALTATTITVAETLTLNAVADTSFTITRPGRKLICPPSGSLVKRYFTVEEYEVDIDASEVTEDVVWGSLRFQMNANGMLTVTAAGTGTGAFETYTGAQAPVFSSPTSTTGIPLAVIDSAVRLGSTDLVDLISADLTISVPLNAPDMATTDISADVFDGQMAISGSLQVLREDVSYVTSFLNETELQLHIMAEQAETAPADFLALFLPNLTLGEPGKSPLSNAAGGRTQTIQIPEQYVGVQEAGGAWDQTMAVIQISNAS